MVIYTRISKIIFLDSTRKIPKDYNRLRQVMDEALLNFDNQGGHIETKKFNNVTHALRFSYNVDFPCLQQPDGSEGDVYYVIYHMMAYIRANNTFTRGSDITEWGRSLQEITDVGLRDEFVRIQLNLATVINKDVLLPEGMFHGGNESADEVEDRLKKQGDTRSFNTLAGVRPLIV
jgi:hypothetical protein